jgi:glutamate synthase (NADPH/NADH) large chain
MWPLIPHGQSDTACLDNALELLVGRRLSAGAGGDDADPEAWAGNPLMDPSAGLLRVPRGPDGAVGRPAAVAFTDGRQIGATLGPQRPAARRFIITDQDHVIMASRWACSTSRRAHRAASGACSPARCC